MCQVRARGAPRGVQWRVRSNPPAALAAPRKWRAAGTMLAASESLYFRREITIAPRGAKRKRRRRLRNRAGSHLAGECDAGVGELAAGGDFEIAVGGKARFVTTAVWAESFFG